MAAQLDPRVSLAGALESQPGVYALLVGSGVSTGAGVPTGWGVVDSLVRRVAVASGETLESSFDAGTWWSANGDGRPLGYSSILERLGPTRAARRALLAGFFEPTDEDRENELKVPSAAHRAIAKLVRAGRIRVIVTTNFDHLLERAIEADETFYIENEPKVRAKQKIDLNFDPPPDLGVEIDLTTDSRRRFGIYAQIAVPEIWRFDGVTVTIHQRQPDGQYVIAERSKFFPFLAASDLTRFLGQRMETDESTLLQSFRQWVRQQVGQGK